MKKTLLLFTFFLTIGFSVQLMAQLPDGSTAPDWTLTDLDGQTHGLYDMLDDGKTVFLEFSATWCAPCWNFHTSGAYEELFNEHGPGGTDDARVFFIEGDLSTNEACLYGPTGCNGTTQGDWVTGTPFPIINLTSSNGPNVTNDYEIGYWPTLYVVCPNRKIYETGQVPANVLETYIESCTMEVTEVSSTDVVCFADMDGTVDITASGGYNSLSYEWSNGESTEDLDNLSAGTYYGTVEDGNGVFVEVEAIVGGPQLPLEVLTVERSDVTCNGISNGEINVEGSGGTSGYSYSWSSGHSGPEIVNLSPGTYTVTLTDGNNCDMTRTYEISEPEVLEATAEVEPALCNVNTGEITVTSDGGTTPYQYNIGNGNQPQNFFSGLAPGEYTVTITDNNNCETTVTKIVEDIDPPVVDVPQDVQTIDCNTNLLEIDGSGSASGPLINYVWATDDGNIVEGQSSPVAIVDEPGTYSLTVIDIEYGCVSVDYVDVETDPTAPTADAGPSKLIECGQQSVSLDGTGSTSGSGYSYQWTTDDGNIVSGATSLTPEVDAAGTYTLEVTNPSGDCSALSSTTVDQDTSFPTVEVQSEGDINCEVTEVLLSSSGSSQGSEFEYTWKDGDGNVISSESEVTVSQGGNYTLEIVNTQNGCTASETVSVETNTDVPFAEAGEPQELDCNNVELSLDGTASETGGQISYLWTTDNGNIVSGENSLEPTVDEPGVYVLTINNNLSQCSSTDTVVVTEFINTPVASFDVQSTNLSIQLNSSLTEGNPSSYSWDFGDGNTSSDANPQHTYETEGTYEICLTIENECGTDEECTTVSVSPSDINVTTTIIDVSCYNGNDGAIDLEVSGAVNVESYSWSNGETTEDINMLPAGEYTVTITSESGSEFTFTYTITQPSEILVESSEIGDLSCFNDNTGSISVIVEGGTGDYSYEWSSGQTEPAISDLEAGEYELTVTDENNCEKIFGPFKVSNQLPLSVENQEIENVSCFEMEDGSISLTVSGGVGSINVEWSNGEVGTEISGLSAGDYNAELTDENGCVSSFGPYSVDSPDELLGEVVAKDDQSGTIDIEVEGGTEPYTYSWSNGSTEEDQSGLDPGTYSVEIRDANNCLETINDINIEVVSTNEIESLESCTIYPNPFSSDLNVNIEFSEHQEGEVSVFNLVGQQVLREEFEGFKFNKIFSMDNYSEGVYIVRVKTQDGVVSRQLIKQ